MESNLRFTHVQHVAVAADLVIALIEDNKDPVLMKRLAEADKTILVSALAAFLAATIADRDYRRLLSAWVEEAAGGVQ